MCRRAARFVMDCFARLGGQVNVKGVLVKGIQAVYVDRMEAK
jgi:hypothetical protein